MFPWQRHKKLIKVKSQCCLCTSYNRPQKLGGRVTRTTTAELRKISVKNELHPIKIEALGHPMCKFGDLISKIKNFERWVKIIFRQKSRFLLKSTTFCKNVARSSHRSFFTLSAHVWHQKNQKLFLFIGKLSPRIYLHP